jgi:hypothetical protein
MIMNRMWPRDVIATTVRAGILVATGYFASPYRKSVENTCRDVQVPCLGSRQCFGRARSQLSPTQGYSERWRAMRPLARNFALFVLQVLSMQKTKHRGGAREVLLGPF